MRNIVKVLLKIIIGFGMMVILLIILSGIFFYILNKTGRISGIAQTFMNHHLVGRMEFDSLAFDFTEFPVIGVAAQNGLLITPDPDAPNDTLASFKKLRAKMNPFKIFSDNLIDIPYVYLEQPKAIVTLNKEGRPGWAIWRFRKKQPAGVVIHKRPPIKLNIRQVEIYGHPEFYYHNLHTGMQITADAQDLFLIGCIAIDYKKIDADYFHLRKLNYRMTIPKANVLIDTRSDSILIRKHLQQDMSNYQLHVVTVNDTVYVRDMAIMTDNNFEVHGKVGVGFGYKAIQVHDLLFQIDTTFLWMRGDFRKVPFLKGMYTNVQVRVGSPNLNQTINELPSLKKHFPPGLRVQLPLWLQGDFTGIFSPDKKIYPDIKSTLTIGPGLVRYQDYPVVTDFFMKMQVAYSPDTHDSYLALPNLRCKILNSALSLSGSVQHPFTNPYARLSVNTSLDIHLLSQLDTAFSGFNGRVKLNADLQTPVKSLLQKDFSKTHVSLAGTTDSLSLVLPGGMTSVNSYSGNIRISVPRPSAFVKKDSMKLDLFLDSIAFSRMGQVNIGVRSVDITMAAPSITGKKQLDVSGKVGLAGVNGLLGNGVRIHADRLSGKWKGVFNENKLFPDSLLMKFAFRKLWGKVDSAYLLTQDLGFLFEGNRIAGDSVSVNTDTLRSIRQLYERYDFSGGVIMNKAIVETPVLPLNNQIDSLLILFNKEMIDVPSIICKSGSSELTVTGKVDNWSKYLLSDSIMVAEIGLLSDSLNLTELIPAIARGVFFLNKQKDSATDSLVKRLLPPQLIPPAKPEERTRAKMISLPANMNVKVNLDATHVEYDKILFDESHGKVLLIDKSIFIHNVFVDSNLGNIEVGASYQPGDSSFAKTALSVDLKRLDVNKLLRIIPDLHRVVPMLETLEGEVGCLISASADVDSTLYIMMPALSGSAQIKGQNLSIEKDKVLPKWAGRLLFGKRSKIVLDSILVNLTMKNNILSIYPFVADLDNYRILASGLQDTDDSFFYHISLLKWFLPFKLGFNIYKEKGAKVKFRLACPQLKDLSLPARIMSVDSAHFYPYRNVPETIYEGLKKQQSVFLKFSGQYDSFQQKEPEEFSKKQTEAILFQLDSLRRGNPESEK
ncbi:MAG: AsmA-like C-terminal region-containing protein [Bacteroidales bacterium]